jgi:hypothetical protein
MPEKWISHTEIPVHGVARDPGDWGSSLTVFV